MEDWQKLRAFYELKKVERTAPVGERKESSAEHSWSSMMLADYFLGILTKKLDRVMVYELLMYHDVVEIEAGDLPIHHEHARKDKAEKEMAAAKVLQKRFPPALGKKFMRLFEEFEGAKTREAQFAKAIDALDALIHFLDYKAYWKGWDEVMVRKFHGKHMAAFPELERTFNNILTFVRSEGYFDQ